MGAHLNVPANLTNSVTGGRALDPVEVMDQLRGARDEVARLRAAMKQAAADLDRPDVDRAYVADALRRVLEG